MIDKLSHEIALGSIVGIIGGNGTGKTTYDKDSQDRRVQHGDGINPTRIKYKPLSL